MSASGRSGTGAGGRESSETGGPPPPESVSEALDRARRHGRAAAAEALAAVRALLDAASLTVRGEAAAAGGLLGPLAQLLEDLSAQLASGEEGAPLPLLQAIAGALDEEIGRWEARAADDPEARAVLRAFLGLRELLWEFGVRQREPAEDARAGRAPDRAAARSRRTARRRPERRVQRIPVEG